MKVKVVKGAVDFKGKRYIQDTETAIFDAPEEVAAKLLKKGVVEKYVPETLKAKPEPAAAEQPAPKAKGK